mgnify:CR=1 FL=1
MRKHQYFRNAHGACAVTVLIAAFVLLILVVGSPQSYASAIRYPALGNFELDEGTIEVWLTPMVDVLYPPDEGQYVVVFDLFQMKVDGEWRMGASWYRHNHQLGLKVSMDSHTMKKGLVGILSKTPRDWAPGERHKIAFTWKGREMALWADGKRIGGRRQAQGFAGKLGGEKLFIGDPQSQKRSRIIVHAVRISSIMREPEELTVQEPQADLATLLLDTFENAEDVEEGVSNVEVMNAMDGRAELTGPHHFVEEPSPGLALY